MSATLREQSERLEAELFGGDDRSFHEVGSGFWVRQRSDDGQAIINAKTSSQQGVELAGVTIFRLRRCRPLPRPHRGQDARVLHDGYWRLEDARIYAEGNAAGRPRDLRSARPT